MRMPMAARHVPRMPRLPRRSPARGAGRTGATHTRDAAPTRRRFPVLMALVYGLFLVLVGLTASAQAGLVSAHVSTTMLNNVVLTDASLVRTFANGTLRLSDFEAGGANPSRVAEIDRALATSVVGGVILRAEIRTADGLVLMSDATSVTGTRMPPIRQFTQAASGTPSVELLDEGVPLDIARSGGLGATRVIREYLPLVSGGTTRGIFVIWRNAQPVLDQIDAARWDVVTLTLTAALIAAVLLYFIFRSAQGRMNRQTDQLIEATRRDGLTGLLNHGAVVSLIAAAIESARANGLGLSLALLDVDNFRALIGTYGYATCDDVLRHLATLLRTAVPEGWSCARYGPDEFLVAAPGDSGEALEAAMRAVRGQLATTALDAGGPDRLPVTVSAGLCRFPNDGNSLTELLSAAVVALREAKAGGGDGMRWASEIPNTRTGSFDVFQGLVIAVDTKDRYTKRHSEDVARYAGFIADRLGVEADVRRAVHIAGLLHDVGKIGIPDSILRKPGPLTVEEREIVQQHVALGDMIVRDVPGIDLVRAGIRHHHERWDGTGYLHRLAGTEIPLIARMLAVADAFSAMTTTRPYRKALSVDEALRRLEDAAGTQLDERLVALFVDGIRAVDGAPLPGQDAAVTSLWTPRLEVA